MNLQEPYATLLAKHDRGAPAIREYRAETPALLAARLAETLNRDPAARPKSARAVLSGVESEISGL